MADPSVRIKLLTNGDMGVGLGSHVKRGLYSQSVIPNCRNLSEADLKRALTILVLAQIKHQGFEYGDNHDEEDTLKCALDLLSEMIKDDRTEIWRNPTTYAPRGVGGGQGIATNKIRKPGRPDWV